MKYTLAASSLALLLGGTNAFSSVRAPFATRIGPLFMSDKDTPPGQTPDALISTGKDDRKKELAFDDKTGRFFETGLEGECIPEDEYCVIDQKTGDSIRLTLEEKERIFLDALQSYYVSGKQVLNDQEFDLLREDLSWNGSDLIVMNRKEAKYLGAMQAYLKGNPIITDEEYNTLKADLKEEGSKFAVSKEPKCYIDTGICTVTLQRDKFRNNLLFLPAGGVLSILWLGLAFEFFNVFIPVNPIILLALGVYPIYLGAKEITEKFIFQDGQIVYGPCPSCEVENRLYFGDILYVEGFGDMAKIKCPACKADFSVQRKSLRASTIPK